MCQQYLGIGVIPYVERDAETEPSSRSDPAEELCEPHKPGLIPMGQHGETASLSDATYNKSNQRVSTLEQS